MVSVKVDVYRRLYLTDAREYERNARSEKILSFRTLVGINGFYVTLFIIPRASLRRKLWRVHTKGLAKAFLNRARTKEFEAITHETLSSNSVCVFDVNDSMRDTYSTDARFDVKAKFSFLSRWPWSFRSFPFRDTRYGVPLVTHIRTGFHVPRTGSPVGVRGCRR